MQERRRRKKKFHAFNKKNSFILLRYAHSLIHFTQLLCYTFYDYILFIIIFICPSFLLSFFYKFVLFFAKFVIVNILCNFFVFDLFSFIFFELLLSFFYRESEREKIQSERENNEDHTALLVLRCTNQGYGPMILVNASDNEDHFSYFQHHIVKQFIIFVDGSVAKCIPQGQR